MPPRTAAATPGRVTRSQTRTPMPVVGAAPTTSYGSKGKAKVQSQMRPTSGTLPEEFSSPTYDAPVYPTLQEEIRHYAHGATSTASPSNPGRRRPAPTHSHQEEVTFRNDTYTEDGAPYLPNRHHQVDTVEVVRSEYSPTNFVVFCRTLPRYMLRLLANIGVKGIVFTAILYASIVAAFIWLPVPASFVARREKFILDTFFTADPRNWRPVQQMSINDIFWRRFDAIESDIKELKIRMDAQEESLHIYRAELPTYLAVRRVNGAWELSNDFWLAMAEKLATDDAAPLWESFIEGNRDLLTLIAEQAVGRPEHDLNDGSYYSLSRDEFVQILQQNSQFMHANFQSLINDAEQRILTQASRIAANVSAAALAKAPGYRLATQQSLALAYANYQRNVRDAMTSTNYFSIGLGARIDPKLTSPTMSKNAPSLMTKFYSMVFGYPKTLPPVAALQEWREAGQCWCAAPSESGKAQITVMMPEKIYPETLIIEHIPKEGTLDITAAPKEIEIWAEAESAESAFEIRKTIRQVVPLSDQSSCGKPPAGNYVCIGAGTYDIHFDNWVQTFPVFIDAPSVAFAADKISVRVKSNWGQDWTCMYRLRMTGQRVLDDPPKVVV